MFKVDKQALRDLRGYSQADNADDRRGYFDFAPTSHPPGSSNRPGPLP